MVRKKIYKNKHGWIRVVEAFVAVLIILGLVLVILDGGYIKKDDPSEDIYTIENSILREVQNNDTLRQEIFVAIVPVSTNDPNFPALTNETINTKKPTYLNCGAKICYLNSECLFFTDVKRSVYSRSVIISTNQSDFEPRKLSLFCYRK